MMGRYRLFFILSFLLLQLKTVAQNIVIYEDDGKTPVIGAHIFCQNVATKANSNFLSDAEGKVNLETTAAKEVVVIHIYALGFKRLTDTLKGRENKQYILDKDASSLNDLVITAQYAPNNPENAVHNVRIIDQKKIAAMGAINLKDLMRNELNIKVTEDNVLGSGLSMQGISGQNVKILVDGVPVIGRLADNVDISQINLNNIERVEMIDGPLSVSYGTDALAGTINLITKKSTQNKLTADVEAFYESIGQYNLNGTLGYSIGKHSFRLNGGRNYFDGWRPTDKQFSYDFNPVADSTRVQTWNPKEQYFTTFNYGYRLKDLQFNYTFDYFYENIHNKGMPDTSTTIYALDDYYKTRRINNAIAVDGKLSEHFRLNGVIAYNYFRRNKNTYRKDLTNLEETLVPETASDDSQDTSVFRTIMSRATIANVKSNTAVNYEIGYDVKSEYASGARILDKKQTMGDYALFASMEWKPVKDLIIRPGMRVAYNTAYSAPLVPSLNVKYSIPVNAASNGRITWRASYARGFRAPTLKELYFDFVDINHNIHGNPDLKAEYSNNYILSVNYSQTKGEWALKSELQGYYNDIKDMISLIQVAPNTTNYAYFNIGEYKSLGFMAQQSLSYRHLKASVGASYIGRYNALSEVSSTATFQYSPEIKANVYYEWHQEGITFGLFYKYNGAVPSFVMGDKDEILKTTTTAYSWADASVSKPFLKKMLDVTIGAKNLFNVTSITGTSDAGVHNSGGSSAVSVGTGRSYFIKLGFHINGNQ